MRENVCLSPESVVLQREALQSLPSSTVTPGDTLLAVHIHHPALFIFCWRCPCVGLPICPATKGVPRSAVKCGHLFISQTWFTVMLNATSGRKSPGNGKGAGSSICSFLNVESARALLPLTTPPPPELPGQSPSPVPAEALRDPAGSAWPPQSVPFPWAPRPPGPPALPW